MQHIAAYLNKSCYAQMYAAFAEIILQRPIASALYWTWLVRVLSGSIIPSLPQCLSWLWMLSVLFSTSCDNPFLAKLESFVITELVTTELSVKVRKTTKFWVWIWLDHVGGTRCCANPGSDPIVHSSLVPRHQIFSRAPCGLFFDESAGRARKIWSGDETKSTLAIICDQHAHFCCNQLRVRLLTVTDSVDLAERDSSLCLVSFCKCSLYVDSQV